MTTTKPTLQSRIDRLTKSAQNVVNAKNAAQREAASKFLVMRANELTADRDELANWLQEADRYANTKTPEINTDQQHENNHMWIRKLREYEAICNALDAAWEAYMGSMEAA